MFYDMIRWEEKALVEAAKRKNIDLRLEDARERFFDVTGNDLPDLGDIILQRCVSFFRSIHLTAFLEEKGYKVVNGFHQSIVSGNKLYTSLALVKNGIPTPRTMLSFTSEASFKALDKMGYPAVLKPTMGSWGRLLAMLKDNESAESIFEDRESMYPLYQVYYLQERVKRPPRDIRSFVIGDRVVAAIYRVSNGHWKTNTALGAKAENCPITKELEDLSLRAARAIGEGIYGVDCMESPEGLQVHEVNSTIEFKNTVPATGVDIPGMIMDYLSDKAAR
ncbi:MAG: lysine biosynthesis protein LysX [Thaumarchaeota archaeon]|nr:lysine biosynthesis protein LysX [Nitrososphaerota archaeon]